MDALSSLFITITFVLMTHASGVSYTIDMNVEEKTIWPFWETCTTFDHGYQALRQDWRQYLLETHLDTGVKYVRFHETFDNDIGIVNPKLDAHDESLWSYINIDKIYDYLLSIGMKPWIELDMMPSSFVPSYQVSNMYDHPVFTGPPANLTLWSRFITSFIQHLTDRYGPEEVSKWYFEAWNEPQCAQNWYQQNLTTFQETWKVTSAAIKSVNKSYNIGGPGSCGGGWIPQFPQYCKDNNIEMDFVSTHEYPSKTGAHDQFFQLLNDLSSTVKKVDSDYNIHITAYGVSLGGYGEVGDHDTSNNAAGFVTFASQFQMLDTKQFGIMSFTGFSDLWDQSGVWSQPFHNGYGWSTMRGIHKATYRVLQLLHKYASDDRFYIPGLNKNTGNSSVELLATVTQNKDEIVLFFANWMPGTQAISEQTVMVNIENVKHSTNLPKYATIMKIDAENTNPAEVWKSIGSPVYPTSEEMDVLMEASEVVPQIMKIDSAENSIKFNFHLPVYGVAVVVIEID